MTIKLEELALDWLFRKAWTRNGRTDRPETEERLRELYELLKFGPTSPNCCPARFVWVRSAEAKSELAAPAAPGNAEKTHPARALGLDCGPMPGLSNDAVDLGFFANTHIKSNFICSIGYGSDQNLFPRNPRLTFEEAGRPA
jgi:3-hydroxypropanoate dehydrogenase